MDWVADGIAIGSAYDTSDPADLERAGIEAVLQLYGPEPFPTALPFAAAVQHLFVVDGEPLAIARLCEGVEFIRAQRALGRRILVACGAGISRSPTFVAAYLHETGMDLLDAFGSIMQRRPQVLPHPELLRSLVAHYQLSVTAETLLVALVRMRSGRRRRDGGDADTESAV